MDTLSKGVIVPLVTPPHADDLYPLIDHVISGGINKIFILGTTGEGSKLDRKKKIELIRSVADHIGKRAHLLIGITSKSRYEALELIHLSEEVHAAACVIAPLVMQDDIASLIDYLLAYSTGKMFLYNNPTLTQNRSIPLEQFTPLLSEKRILGIKDSSGDLEYFDRLLHMRTQCHWKVYYGREHLLSEALKREVDGMVSACGNIAPQLVSRLWEARDEATWKEWYQLKEAINRMHPNYLTGLKALMQEKGLYRNG